MNYFSSKTAAPPNPNRVSYRCPVCDIRIKDRGIVATHIRQVHLNCAVCLGSFPNLSERSAHPRAVQHCWCVEHACAFESMAELGHHYQRKHCSRTAKETHKCHLCEISLGSKDALDAHLKGPKHVSIAFKWPDCSFTCTTQGTRDAHLKHSTHGPEPKTPPEKPYKCQQCSKYFKKDEYLKNHATNTGHLTFPKVLPRDTTEIVTKAPHKCQVCNLFFDTTNSLDRHEADAAHQQAFEALKKARQPRYAGDSRHDAELTTTPGNQDPDRLVRTEKGVHSLDKLADQSPPAQDLLEPGAEDDLDTVVVFRPKMVNPTKTIRTHSQGQGRVQKRVSRTGGVALCIVEQKSQDMSPAVPILEDSAQLSETRRSWQYRKGSKNAGKIFWRIKASFNPA